MKLKSHPSGEVVEATRVNVVGSTDAYDVFYGIKGDWHHDLTLEILEEDPKVKELEATIQRWADAKLSIRFNLEIDLTLEAEAGICQMCSHYHSLPESRITDDVQGRCRRTRTLVDELDTCSFFTFKDPATNVTT